MFVSSHKLTIDFIDTRPFAARCFEKYQHICILNVDILSHLERLEYFLRHLSQIICAESLGNLRVIKTVTRLQTNESLCYIINLTHCKYLSFHLQTSTDLRGTFITKQEKILSHQEICTANDYND